MTGKNLLQTFERITRESAQSVYAQRQSVANRLSTAYGRGAVHGFGAIAGKLGFAALLAPGIGYGPNSLALQATWQVNFIRVLAETEPVSGVAGDL